MWDTVVCPSRAPIDHQQPKIFMTKPNKMFFFFFFLWTFVHWNTWWGEVACFGTTDLLPVTARETQSARIRYGELESERDLMKGVVGLTHAWYSIKPKDQLHTHAKRSIMVCHLNAFFFLHGGRPYHKFFLLYFPSICPDLSI
jgi:hypothetical protein